MSPTAARLSLLVAAVFWSTSGALLKSLPDVHWLAVAGVRSLFASLLFLPGLRGPRPPARRLTVAVLLYAVLVSTLMGSMQLGTAAQGIWLQYIAPAVVALWTFFLWRQRLRWSEILAAALSVVAVLLIVSGGAGRAHAQSVLLGLVSGFAFAFFIISLTGFGDVSPPLIHVWTNLGTAALLIPLALILGVALPTFPRDILILAAMGLGQLALPYYLFQRALPHVRAVEASLIILLEPILNPIWTYLVVGEVPAPRVIGGCAMIAAGLVVYTLGPRGRSDDPSAASETGGEQA